MNSELQVFDFGQNHVRVLGTFDEPWFVAADVCEILGIQNPRDAIADFDRDDVVTTDIIDSLGRKQNINTVSESGLYQLIFQSRKPEAKAFQKWVTREVLPSIRKHGFYRAIRASKKGVAPKPLKRSTDEMVLKVDREIVRCLMLVAEEYSNFRGKTSELMGLVEKLAVEEFRSLPTWPVNSTRFGIRLSHVAEDLLNLGVGFHRKHGQKAQEVYLWKLTEAQLDIPKAQESSSFSRLERTVEMLVQRVEKLESEK